MSSIYTCGPSGLFVPPTIHKPRPVVYWICMVCNSPGWSNVGEELVECLSVGSPESLVTSEETLCCSTVRCPLLLYSGDLSEEWASPLKWRVYSVLLAGVESFWRLELYDGGSCAPSKSKMQGWAFSSFFFLLQLDLVKAIFNNKVLLSLE